MLAVVVAVAYQVDLEIRRVARLRVRGGRDLGTRRTFADVGATVAEAMGVPLPEVGTSVLREVWVA